MYLVFHCNVSNANEIKKVLSSFGFMNEEVEDANVASSTTSY